MSSHGGLYCKTHGGYILECMGCKNDHLLYQIESMFRENDLLKRKLGHAIEVLNEFARYDIEPKYLAWPASEFAKKSREALEKIKP